MASHIDLVQSSFECLRLGRAWKREDSSVKFILVRKGLRNKLTKAQS
jgi:hypothetical protein